MKDELVDCPVLRKPVWDEEDALVAMDWALERGLIDDREARRFLPPAWNDYPKFTRLMFLVNATSANKAWEAWSDYEHGRHQAANDKAYSPGGMNEVRRTIAYLHNQKHDFSYAFVLGYTEWAREQEEPQEPKENPCRRRRPVNRSRLTPFQEGYIQAALGLTHGGLAERDRHESSFSAGPVGPVDMLKAILGLGDLPSWYKPSPLAEESFAYMPLDRIERSTLLHMLDDCHVYEKMYFDVTGRSVAQLSRVDAYKLGNAFFYARFGEIVPLLGETLSNRVIKMESFSLDYDEDTEMIYGTWS